MREASSSLREGREGSVEGWWWDCCSEEKGQKRHGEGCSPAKTAVSVPNQKLRSFVGTTGKQSRLEGKEDQGDQVAQKGGGSQESLRKKQQL